MSEHVKNEELLPCPFCGSLDLEKYQSFICCRYCGADGPFDNKSFNWNTRTTRTEKQ